MAKLTSKEVADRLDLGHITVLRYIRAGKIRASYIGRSYRVDEAEVAEFLRRSEGQQSNAGPRKVKTA